MENNKDIYMMFNDAEINIEDYTKEELSEFEKKKFKKNLKSKIKNKDKKAYSKYAAAICAVIVGISILGSDAGASAIHKAEVISNKISALLGVDKDLDDYSTIVGKAEKDKGITVQLNEVILDGDELIVSSNVVMDEKMNDEDIPIADMDIYVDGKMISNGAGGSMDRIDDYTTEQIIKHTLDGPQLKGDVNIKIVCNNIMIDGNTIKGNWVFNFKTNGDALRIDTKEIPLNNEIILPDDGIYTLEKYTDNSVGQKIYAHVQKGSSKAGYDIEFKGYDDLGNRIEFSLIHGDEDSAVFQLQTLVGCIGENAEYLTLTPYALKYPDENGAMEYPEVAGEEFKIDLTSVK